MTHKNDHSWWFNVIYLLLIIILWQNDEEKGFFKVTMAKIDQVIMKNGNEDHNNDNN